MAYKVKIFEYEQTSQVCREAEKEISLPSRLDLLSSHTEDDIIIDPCQTEKHREITRSPGTVKKATSAEKKYPADPMRNAIVEDGQESKKREEGDGMERHVSSFCRKDKRI